RRPPVPAVARVAHARPRAREPGPALVVHRDARSALEHARHRRARPAARGARAVPVAAPPQLRRRRRRGVRPAARALVLGDGGRVHRAQRRPAGPVPHPRRGARPHARDHRDPPRRRRTRSGHAVTRARTDVLVVGGGPVGLAAALHARRAGHDVVVVDRRAGVIDKACGEGLLPGALAAVLDLGVDPPGHPLAGISYRDATRHADHPFAAGPGRGVRRTALHAALRERALAEGVVVEHATLRTLTQDARGVDVTLDPHDDAPSDQGDGSRVVRADWLLGCDGLHSTVRRLAGLDAPARGRARFGLRTHYRVAPWTDLVEVHWAP